MAFFTEDEAGFTLHLWVTPKAGGDGAGGLTDRPDGTMALLVRVRALPEKGAANKAVIAVLAKRLRLPKSSFTLTAGETGRAKTLRLETQKAPAEEIRQRLASLV